MNELLHVPVNQIRENPVALRTVNKMAEDFIQVRDSVKAIVASTGKMRGVLNPINVQRKNDPATGEPYFELVDGLHRWTAAIEAGLETIPAQVVEMTQIETMQAQLIANVHKVETRPVDYTKQLQRIMAMNPLLTLNELASQLSKSPTWITERLSLLKLTEKVATLVNEGKINLTNAYAIARLPEDEQADWVDKAQIQPPSEFTPAVHARVKEIKDARRKGRDENAPSFVATAHLQKLAAIKNEMENPEIGPALVKLTGVETAKEGFDLAIKWVLHMDPQSIAAGQAKWDAQEAEKNRKRDERKAEREAKKASDAATASVDAAEDDEAGE